MGDLGERDRLLDVAVRREVGRVVGTYQFRGDHRRVLQGLGERLRTGPIQMPDLATRGSISAMVSSAKRRTRAAPDLVLVAALADRGDVFGDLVEDAEFVGEDP